ncbi:hypothetical protein HOL34_03545 [bacterium]|jgi:hypothetical protein|nr:hypothetical protein [bacterium]MBT3903862.1 hypothetical protein [bacterium]MBT4578006.1 hypothetical protein [bacterium]MBT5346209.1 hypothetical protein [bacterium]MBT6131005.1 hypothetical protein [bacterium]
MKKQLFVALLMATGLIVNAQAVVVEDQHVNNKCAALCKKMDSAPKGSVAARQASQLYFHNCLCSDPAGYGGQPGTYPGSHGFSNEQTTVNGFDVSVGNKVLNGSYGAHSGVRSRHNRPVKRRIFKNRRK